MVDTPEGEDALAVARRTFVEIGASSVDWLPNVRAPLPHEDRAEVAVVAASPREVRQAALERQIRDAFASVRPEGRVTLREAFRADHDLEADGEWRDGDTAWSEIPADVLETFGARTSVFVFGNVESFRYYLPAYMIHMLRTRARKPTIAALDQEPPVASLDAAQRRAVRDFLQYVIDYDGPDPIAERALERVWGRA